MGNEKVRDGIGTMPDPESRLSRKRSQKEFEELLLKDVLMEPEAGEGDFWERKAMELAGQPGYTPTAEQRAAFEERLDLEVKRIQKLEQEIYQIPNDDEIFMEMEASVEAETSMETGPAMETESSHEVEVPMVSSKFTESQEPLRIAERRQRRQRILRKVCSVAAVLALFFFMTMYHTVDAFAAGVDRFIATMVPADGAEELRIEEKEGAGLELNMADYAGMYVPDWIPKGYFISHIENDTYLRKIVFKNKTGDLISFEASKIDNSLFVDDEEVIEEKVYILDTWAKVLKMNEMAYVVWDDAEYIYTVSGNKRITDDLIKMVEKSIKIE